MENELIEPAQDTIQSQMFVTNDKEFIKLQNRHVPTAQSTTGLCLR
jgi:hypothetical protein